MLVGTGGTGGGNSTGEVSIGGVAVRCSEVANKFDTLVMSSQYGSLIGIHFLLLSK
jgi:hypothetical protein